MVLRCVILLVSLPLIGCVIGFLAACWKVTGDTCLALNTTAAVFEWTLAILFGSFITLLAFDLHLLKED
jgi:hypothetical protein